MSIQAARDAIKAGEIEAAKDHLRPLMQADNAEAYVLAARIAQSREQRQQFLERALAIDPFHEEAAQALKLLQPNDALFDEEDTRSDDRKRIQAISRVFMDNGWQMSWQKDNAAHFTILQNLDRTTAFMYGFFLNVFGLAMVYYLIRENSSEHDMTVDIHEDGAIHVAGTLGHERIGKLNDLLPLVQSVKGINISEGLVTALVGIGMAFAALFILMLLFPCALFSWLM